jgi:hypothetical protein
MPAVLACTDKLFEHILHSLAAAAQSSAHHIPSRNVIPWTPAVTVIPEPVDTAERIVTPLAEEAITVLSAQNGDFNHCRLSNVNTGSADVGQDVGHDVGQDSALAIRHTEHHLRFLSLGVDCSTKRVQMVSGAIKSTPDPRGECTRHRDSPPSRWHQQHLPARGTWYRWTGDADVFGGDVVAGALLVQRIETVVSGGSPSQLELLMTSSQWALSCWPCM